MRPRFVFATKEDKLQAIVEVVNVPTQDVIRRYIVMMGDEQIEQCLIIERRFDRVKLFFRLIVVAFLYGLVVGEAFDPLPALSETPEKGRRIAPATIAAFTSSAVLSL